MYKTVIKVFVIILLASLLMLLLIPYISNKIQFITLFSFIGYFYLTLFSFKIFSNKLSPVSIIVIIFLTMVLLQLHTILMWFLIRDPFSVPTIIAHCLGVFSAYFYYANKPPKNILVFSLSSCFVVFMFFQGWDLWIHKIDYGTFTGKTQASNLPAKFESFDEKRNSFTNEKFTNKIVLLDFWTTTCSICFKKFPQVQTLSEKYKNDSSVMILAVNSPLEEDVPNQAFEMIKEREYDFLVVITKDESLAEKFGVTGYPTTFVINQNGQIVYKGDIEGAVKMVDDLKSNSQ